MDVMLPVPLMSQTQGASQIWEPTAVWRIWRQSLVLGWFPLLTGCPQSPCAAKASEGANMRNANAEKILHRRATKTFFISKPSHLTSTTCTRLILTRDHCR